VGGFLADRQNDSLRPGQVSVTDRRLRGGRAFLGLLTSIVVLTGIPAASAETLDSALARAYRNNPTLNAQRANTRAVDENVAQAKAGYRPRVNGSADINATYTETERGGITTERTTSSRGLGVTIDQNLFDGFRTRNSVRRAESGVLGSWETLRDTEQDTLLNAATVYMNVLRDTAIVNLQRNNVEVLEEQLRQTQDRFNVGEVTRTDVAQAEAALAEARSEVSGAEARLRTSIAQFRQVVGVEPRSLAPGRPLDNLVPRNVEAALRLGLAEHPAIKSALHALDAAELQVRVTEGELYPTLGVRGSVSRRQDRTLSANPALTPLGGGQPSGTDTLQGSVVAQLTVPIYEGGQVYSRVRQAKETAGQRRLEADATRDEIRAAVISAWGEYEAARAQIVSGQAQVEAAETALSGVREEARVGQRTTLDVLNQQQELLGARVNLITAQRDRVVASYAVVRATGRLNTRFLGLKVPHYSPKVHYNQVKDLWGGLTTPDGR
jgi:outer membrane protein